MIKNSIAIYVIYYIEWPESGYTVTFYNGKELSQLVVPPFLLFKGNTSKSTRVTVILQKIFKIAADKKF